MMQFSEFYGRERQKELLHEAEQRRVARAALAAGRSWELLRNGLRAGLVAVWGLLFN